MEQACCICLTRSIGRLAHILCSLHQCHVSTISLQTGSGHIGMPNNKPGAGFQRSVCHNPTRFAQFAGHACQHVAVGHMFLVHATRGPQCIGTHARFNRLFVDDCVGMFSGTPGFAVVLPRRRAPIGEQFCQRSAQPEGRACVANLFALRDHCVRGCVCVDAA